LCNYSAIVDAFQDLIDEGDHRSLDAKGLILAVRESIFIVSIFVLHKQLGPIKILLDRLKNIDYFNRALVCHHHNFSTALGKSLDYAQTQVLIASVVENFEERSKRASIQNNLRWYIGVR
jgi:hypothetical protein